MTDAQTRCAEAVAGHADPIDLTGVDRVGWLAKRRKGLGGSDAGAVLGVNPYSGPFELWLNKTGRLADQDLSDNEAVYWGNTLEDIVCDEFARRADTTVWKPTAMYRSRANPWQLANPDRFCIDPENGEPAFFEAKTAGYFQRRDWADGIPPHYEAQIIHYAAVLGLRRAWVGVLLAGQQFEWQRVDVPEELIDDVTAAERHFWTAYVEADQPPPVDGSDSCSDALREMWDALESTALLDDDALDVAIGYLQASDAVKQAEAAKKELGNRLRAAMAENSYAAVDGVQIASNKAIETTRTDWKAVAAEAALLLGIELDDLVQPRHKTTEAHRRLTVPKRVLALAESNGAPL